MTFCRITRNDAEKRIAAIFNGDADPGFLVSEGEQPANQIELVTEDDSAVADLVQAAHDQIVAHVQLRFREHALARLVDAILTAEGWVTKLSPPGPDGGVDILGGRG